MAQAPSWQWVRTSGGNGREHSNDITSDVYGNVYVTGGYSSPAISFDTILLINPSNPYFKDIFIVKYDPNGNVLWAKSEGGYNTDEGLGIALDPAGDIFITGTFDGFVSFDGDTVFNNGINYKDIFIVKHNASGNVLWAKSAGSTGNDFSNDIAVDASGNSYLTGSFGNPSIDFNGTIFTNGTGRDVFVTKYDPLGNVIWARRTLGNGNDESKQIGIGENNNIYISGNFMSPQIDFGGIILNNSDPSGLTSDSFIAKYDSSGTLIWAHSFGGLLGDGCEYIYVDTNGVSFITGYFSSPTINLGGITLTNSNAAGGTNNIFVAKLDSSGNSFWAKSATGNNGDVGIGLDVDLNGNSYVTGYFNSDTISFGSIDLLQTGLGSSSEDMFVVKYNSAGQELWALSVGGTTDRERGSGIIVDQSSNCYVTGYFESNPLFFGAIPVVNYNNEDFFLAKLDSTIINGINENSILGGAMFPNPVNNILKMDFGFVYHRIVFTFSDIAGKIIFTRQYSERQRVDVDLSNFPNGIYLVNLQTEKHSLTKKIIISR